jgi:hypothetical protein
MNVQLDPNWDNTALIIDCSASRKRKQEELEKYTAYAVEMKAKEENSGETQSPAPGTLEYIPTTAGRIVSIVPLIDLNRSQSGVAKKRPTVLCELKHPKLGGTVVPVKNYSKHYVDPDYVSVDHQKLIGMIKQWKMVVLDIIKEMEEEWEYSWFAFKEQHNWAKTQLDPLMVGISKFSMVSIGLLNAEAVMDLVQGIDDEEKADFVIKLARCKCCEIALVRHDHLNNCSIVTIFDEDNKRKIAYGKKEIKDYSSPKNNKKSRYIVK